VVLTAEIALNNDVLSQWNIAEVALETVGMIELVVDSKDVLHDVLAACCAHLTEQVEIIISTVHFTLFLKDRTLSCERNAAMVTFETRHMVRASI
jgi:hypothetical protein